MAIFVDYEPPRPLCERLLDVVGETLMVICALVPLAALVLDALGVYR